MATPESSNIHWHLTKLYLPKIAICHSWYWGGISQAKYWAVQVDGYDCIWQSWWSLKHITKSCLYSTYEINEKMKYNTQTTFVCGNNNLISRSFLYCCSAYVFMITKRQLQELQVSRLTPVSILLDQVMPHKVCHYTMH